MFCSLLFLWFFVILWCPLSFFVVCLVAFIFLECAFCTQLFLMFVVSYHHSTFTEVVVRRARLHDTVRVPRTFSEASAVGKAQWELVEQDGTLDGWISLDNHQSGRWQLSLTRSYEHGKSHSGGPFFFHVFSALVSAILRQSRVLTMERIEGVPFSDICADPQCQAIGKILQQDTYFILENICILHVILFKNIQDIRYHTQFDWDDWDDWAGSYCSNSGFWPVHLVIVRGTVKNDLNTTYNIGSFKKNIQN